MFIVIKSSKIHFVAQDQLEVVLNLTDFHRFKRCVRTCSDFPVVYKKTTFCLLAYQKIRTDKNCLLHSVFVVVDKFSVKCFFADVQVAFHASSHGIIYVYTALI